LLFDVIGDVGSNTSVADDHPAVVKRLMRLAERARVELGDRGRPGSGQRPAGTVDDPQPMTR
jgi:hypothetical protein